MKSKNGFTLIELLAIIVILAIIAVITVPIILNIIEDSHKGAALDSAYGFKDSINTYYISKLGSSENFSLNKTFTIDDGKLDEIELNFSGTRPTSGTLTYQNNELVSGCLVVDGYKVEYNNGKFETTGKGECETFICEYGKLKKVTYEYVPSATQEQKQKCVEFLKSLDSPSYDSGDNYNKLCNGESLNGDYTIVDEVDSGMDVAIGILNTGVIKETITDKRCLELDEFYIEDDTLYGIDIDDYDYIMYGTLNIPGNINGTEIKKISSWSDFSYQNLSSVIIPNTVTEIGAYAFTVNTIENVVIPNSVTTIEEGAFYNNNLKSLTLPSSVTTIEATSFNKNNLPDNQAIIYARNDDGTIDTTTIVSYGGANKNPSIPDGVTTIGGTAFMDNELTSVIIPNSVTKIEYSAFSYNKLTSVVLPNNLTTIGAGAFNRNKLTSVEIPNSVTEIEGSAFEFNQLTSVTLGNNLTYIGSEAFYVNQIENVDIPSSVSYIGVLAFGHNNLKNLTLHEGITTIENGAFEKNQLTNVTIPNSATTMGSNIFEVNPNLTINVIGYTSKPSGWNSYWNRSGSGVNAYTINWNYGG